MTKKIFTNPIVQKESNVLNGNMDDVFVLFEDNTPAFAAAKAYEANRQLLGAQDIIHLKNDISKYRPSSLTHHYSKNKFDWISTADGILYHPSGKLKLVKNLASMENLGKIQALTYGYFTQGIGQEYYDAFSGPEFKAEKVHIGNSEEYDLDKIVNNPLIKALVPNKDTRQTYLNNIQKKAEDEDGEFLPGVNVGIDRFTGTRYKTVQARLIVLNDASFVHLDGPMDNPCSFIAESLYAKRSPRASNLWPYEVDKFGNPIIEESINTFVDQF